MPTLELVSLQGEQEQYPPILHRGYDSSFFKDIEDLFDTLQMEEGIDRDELENLTTNLLRAGPCPGNARVYHTFVSSPDFPDRHEDIDEVLGKEVSLSRRELGNDFEIWVDDANEAFNSWLETRDIEVFEELDVPPKLKDFYIERARELEDRYEDLEDDHDQLKMDVQIQVTTSLFHESTPDGAWTSAQDFPGGVFESKLSLPPDPVHKYALAGYAAHIERSKDIPIEFGIFLYLDDDLDDLKVESFFIDDVLRDSIKDNLEIFSSLAFQSIAQGEWEEGEQIVDRLVEPEEPKYDSPCQNCLYQHECHHYGKYEQALVRNYNDLSNLKLSGTQILPLLKTIHEHGPRRSDVVESVMEEHFPDSSKKSVFRGMVVPTMKRLHLVRMMRDGKNIRLSPNGRFIFSESGDRTPAEKLDMCIRDYVIEELGFTQNMVEYVNEYMDNLPRRLEEIDTSTDRSFGNLPENFRRFLRNYVEPFSVSIPDETELLNGHLEYLYPGEFHRYLHDPEERKQLLESSLPKNRQIQMEQARSKMMKTLQQQGLHSSSWFTDEVLWKERQHDQPMIKLWEGSKHDRTKLVRGNIAYDGVLRQE